MAHNDWLAVGRLALITQPSLDAHIDLASIMLALGNVDGAEQAARRALSFDPQSVAAHVKTGRLRLLATCGEKRSLSFPDTPTMVESGFPKVTVTGWWGLIAPAGTPQDIVQKASRDTARLLHMAEQRDRLIGVGAEPAGTTPEQFAAFIKSETEKWLRVSKAAGVYQSQ